MIKIATLKIAMEKQAKHGSELSLKIDPVCQIKDVELLPLLVAKKLLKQGCGTQRETSHTNAI